MNLISEAGIITGAMILIAQSQSSSPLTALVIFFVGIIIGAFCTYLADKKDRDDRERKRNARRG